MRNDMRERCAASALTTCLSTANDTSGGCWQSTRSTTTNIGRTSRGNNDPLHEPGQPIVMTARINRTHVVHSLINEYHGAA